MAPEMQKLVDNEDDLSLYLDEFATLIDPNTLLQRVPNEQWDLMDSNRSLKPKTSA